MSAKKITPRESCKMFNKMAREWFPHCSTLERVALAFVFDRTYHEGRRTAPITTRQCVEGVRDSDGNQISFAWASKQERALKTLNSLVDKGFLLKIEHGRKRIFGLNPNA